MPKYLRWKWLLILATVVICILAVTGLPTSRQQLLGNVNRNVRLGLDLKGGSHLVLQVQLQDAFKAEADLIIEQLKGVLQKHGITYVSIDRNEPISMQTAETIAIEVRGIPTASDGDFARIANQTVGEHWTLQRQAEGLYRLQMRKTAALALSQATLTQTIETLDRKVNALGVSEASVQQRGGVDADAEVLVQLPGVDDPVRVRSILQTAAMLELTEVKGGPYSSREEALAAHGGVLPLNSKLAQGSARTGDSKLVAAGSVASRDGTRSTRCARSGRREWIWMGDQLRSNSGCGGALSTVHRSQCR